MKKIFAYLILICVLFTSPLAASSESIARQGYHALTVGNSSNFNGELAADMSVLAATAYYDRNWDNGFLKSLGYRDIVSFAGGLIDDGSYSSVLGANIKEMPLLDIPTTNGFACLKDIYVDGQKKTMVVISVAGTQNTADWLRDFRFSPDEQGRHTGFGQNADGITNLQPAIKFDSENKTLADIIAEAQSGSDDYLLCITGHSLGAAVANLYAQSLYDNGNGLGKESLVAYTFATPLTNAAGSVQNPETFPIFNILNIGDAITYVGADVADGIRPGYDFKYGDYEGLLELLSTIALDAYTPGLNPGMEIIQKATVLRSLIDYLYFHHELENENGYLAASEWIREQTSGDQTNIDAIIERTETVSSIDEPLQRAETVTSIDSTPGQTIAPEPTKEPETTDSSIIRDTRGRIFTAYFENETAQWNDELILHIETDASVTDLQVYNALGRGTKCDEPVSSEDGIKKWTVKWKGQHKDGLQVFTIRTHIDGGVFDWATVSIGFGTGERGEQIFSADFDESTVGLGDTVKLRVITTDNVGKLSLTDAGSHTILSSTAPTSTQDGKFVWDLSWIADKLGEEQLVTISAVDDLGTTARIRRWFSVVEFSLHKDESVDDKTEASNENEKPKIVRIPCVLDSQYSLNSSSPEDEHYYIYGATYYDGEAIDPLIEEHHNLSKKTGKEDRARRDELTNEIFSYFDVYYILPAAEYTSELRQSHWETWALEAGGIRSDTGIYNLAKFRSYGMYIYKWKDE